jgi:HAD superfamily hydrolase (TIGR01509 family)
MCSPASTDNCQERLVRSPEDRELAAVLFDMDGTIVDTEPFWIEAEYALVAAHGGQWNDDHAHKLVGGALLDSAAYIRQHGPVALTPAEIVDELLVRVIAAARHDAPFRPGVHGLLDQLRAAGVPRAMVTMSYESLAVTVAEQLGPGAFDAIVCGDHVDRGKPHPEPYLTAAAILGVDPSRCVAIEDSSTGIASAVAAGCAVVAIPNAVPVPSSPRYTLVSSLADLDLDALERLVRVTMASRSDADGTAGTGQRG